MLKLRTLNKPRSSSPDKDVGLSSPRPGFNRPKRPEQIPAGAFIFITYQLGENKSDDLDFGVLEKEEGKEKALT